MRFKSNSSDALFKVFDICRTFFGMSHNETLLKYSLLIMTVFITSTVSAQQSCQDLFQPQANKRIHIEDLNSLSQAMSSGMLLRPEQAEIFELYKKISFGDPNADVGSKTLTSVTELLKKYPDLEKKMFTEFEIASLERVYETPEALSKHIKSKITTAGQIKNNLLQIESNFDFWKKLLDYQDPKLPEHLQPIQLGKESSEADRQMARDRNQKRADWNQQNKLRFKKYIYQLINNIYKAHPILLKTLESKDASYVQKTEALFKTLQYIYKWLDKNNRNTQTVRQAMVDLVYTMGFGNKSTLDLLKSENALDKVQGLNQLWSEMDGFAETLGYANHFEQLKQELGIEFPTGSTKNENPLEVNQKLEEIVIQQKYTNRPSEKVRVRSLSLQESAFRSCLGNDCSTRTYFDKALDPNYIYFTMTDANHHSDGHATLVLGTATNPKTGNQEKVAFLDKLQNIPTTKIEVFLAAVDESLQSEGYRLAIPTYLGRDIPHHGGLSNMEIITDFVQSNIMNRLTEKRSEFTPHEHQYDFPNKYSRGDIRLEVKLFVAKVLDKTTSIQRGQKHQVYLAEENLNKQQLAQSVLKLKDSENPEDIKKFISMSDGIIKLGLYTKDQMLKDLQAIAKDPSRDYKTRKQAMMEMAFISGSFKEVFQILEKQSEKEIEQFLNELMSYKNSTNNKLVSLNEKLNWEDVGESFNFFKVLAKNNYTINKKTALHWTADKGWKEIFDYLLKQSGIDVNFKGSFGRTALHLAAKNGWKEAIEIIVKQPGIDLNVKDIQDQTALHWAAEQGWKESFEYILKQPGVDVNIKDVFGQTALRLAADKSWKESFEYILKQPGVDVNVTNRHGQTVLHLVVDKGNKEAFETILKHPRLDVNVKNRYGQTALYLAVDKGNKEAFDLLLQHPQVIKDPYVMELAKQKGWL